jgi:hypothetical protein
MRSLANCARGGRRSVYRDARLRTEYWMRSLEGLPPDVMYKEKERLFSDLGSSEPLPSTHCLEILLIVLEVTLWPDICKHFAGMLTLHIKLEAP